MRSARGFVVVAQHLRRVQGGRLPRVVAETRALSRSSTERASVARSVVEVAAGFLLGCPDRARKQHEQLAIDCLWRMLAPVRAEAATLDIDDAPHLRRKMIEIFDARLLLRPYRHPGLHSLALGIARLRNFTHDHACMFADALDLRVALERHHRGIRVSIEPDDVDVQPQKATLFADEDQEIAWLARLADLTVHDGYVCEIAEWACEYLGRCAVS